MCLARTAGKRKFVKARSRSTRPMRVTPGNSPSRRFAKNSRFATGPFMPTESGSRRLIFRRDGSKLSRCGGGEAFDRLDVTGEQAAGLIEVPRPQCGQNQAVILM